MAALLAVSIAAGAFLTLAGGSASVLAQSVRPAEPTRINLTQSDLEFILTQIKIAEAHPDGTGTLCTDPAATTNALACPDQVRNAVLPYGIRQTNGQNNNLIAGKELYGSVDRTFPRLTTARYDGADPLFFDPDGPGPSKVGDATTYASNSGFVVDADPRIISNLISDQTDRNPAATAAADETNGHGFGAGEVMVDHDRNPATPAIVQYTLPNIAPDAGFSASYNSLFTLFGQFFDHGLDLAQKGGSGTVFVPLKADDPLYVAGSPSNFMVLTRATNQPGADGVLGTADDVKDAKNIVTPYIDNNQTYGSHASHQVFLREYRLNEFDLPVATGRLLEGTDGSVANWTEVKAQARTMFGIALSDFDVTAVPLLATDAYGRFLPGLNGYPQIVTKSGTLVEGNPAAPVSPTAVNAERAGVAFLDDIAHHAAPGTWDHDSNPATPKVNQAADTNQGTTDDNLAGTYDDEMLGLHFICGDGRCNENIGLTTIHQIFHSEHNGLVRQLEEFIPTLPATSPASLAAWKLADGSWNGERIFQAAKFVNEMEYQHIVFGEFARAIQPAVNLFDAYDPSSDPAITAEFAHAVYRFGHSMLTETVARTNADGSANDIDLMSAFLNPVSYYDGGSAGTLTPEEAAGSVVRGMVAQRGEEIDEFITEALRNNLVGLPLDLATLNITRARSEGIAPLNQVRRELYNGNLPGASFNTSLKPYASWAEFGLALRHTASLVNFVAAYGKHSTITAATTVAAKRAAADKIVNGGVGTPADATAFLNSTGAWAPVSGKAVSGLEDVDLWMGGLAEAPPLFGGMLGSTFNFVFESQMEALQDHDRLYYIARNAGLPLLTELESNTFADLIRRTTDAVNVPVMAFTRTDYTFDLSAQTDNNGIVDDPNTPYYEPNLDGVSKLLRMADGTIRLTGRGTTENHTTWMGTNGDDKVRSAEGDDSLWGNDGDDRLEGGVGADMIEGGYGNDVLTDSTGDDVISGDDGSDVIHGGRGIDLLFGDNGDDLVIHGADDKESFGGSGDDIVIGGAGVDTVSGGPGVDWVEGGLGADGLTGDDVAPFAVLTGEDDIMIGDGGDDVYSSEGGMDIAFAGSGLDKVIGGLGFDFVSYARSITGAFADLTLPIIAAGGLANPRDRFQTVEGVSGGQYDDTLRGDDRLRLIGHELTQTNLDNVGGLTELLMNGQMLAAPGSGNMFTGDDIVIGGAGSDMVEGGGGNDLLDGDAYLDANLICTYDDGTVVRVASATVLQDDFLAQRLLPQQCDIERNIIYPEDRSGTDTAVYRFPMDQYIVGQLPDGRVFVSHIPVNGGGGGNVNAGGPRNEGTDVLVNFEQVQFSDQTISILPVDLNTSVAGVVTIDNTTPAQGDILTATPDVYDPDGIDPATEDYLWQIESAPDVWTDLAHGQQYTVTANEVGFALRVVYSFTDLLGGFESVISDPTATALAFATPGPRVELTLSVPATVESTQLPISASFLQVEPGVADIPLIDVQVGFDINGTTQWANTDATGVASLTVDLTAMPDTLLSITASAIDPADPTLTRIVTPTELREIWYPSVWISNITDVTEGATGTTGQMVATFTLDRPAPGPISLNWTTADNTATAGLDYTAASGTVQFATGDLSADVIVDVLGDELVEYDETIDFTITGGVGAVATVPSTLSGLVIDNDVPNLVLGADQSAPELAADGTASTMVFDLSLDQAPVAPVTVDWALIGGTATDGTDFLSGSGIATFAPGETTTQIVVTVSDDAEVEFSEDFTVSLSNVIGATAPATLTMAGTIDDNDAPIVSAVAAAPVIEGNVAARTAQQFRITLDRPSVHTVSVNWSTANGTAILRSDYTAASGTAVFAPGTTSTTVSVTVLGDIAREPDETYNLTITGVTNGVVGTASASGKILDDEVLPNMTINDINVVEGNTGTTAATFTITLSKAPLVTTTVWADVIASTILPKASIPADVSMVKTKITFAPGQTTATVTAQVATDRVKEVNEKFFVRLATATGAYITDAIGAGTILNDD
ncbi:MAG: hypothetical protein RI900_3361 [Actinomycetota bacterium]